MSSVQRDLSVNLPAERFHQPNQLHGLPNLKVRMGANMTEHQSENLPGEGMYHLTSPLCMCAVPTERETHRGAHPFTLHLHYAF